METMNIDYEKYAERLGIDLYQEYSADEASKLLRVGINRLRGARTAGELNAITLGKSHSVYLGLDLVLWKLSKHTKLEIITSPKIDKANGAEHGMTHKPSKEKLQAFALDALSPPSQR